METTRSEGQQLTPSLRTDDVSFENDVCDVSGHRCWKVRSERQRGGKTAEKGGASFGGNESF